MSSDPVIALAGIGKTYAVYQKPHHRLLQMLSRQPGRWHREFDALRDIDLEIRRGETVGIVGRNGSGKSTLLQVICGTLAPTRGQARISGRIAALLELGAGFNPDFTGRENVYLNGSILGLSREAIDRRLGEILAFADIGDFIDQPVKNYSSGMYVRLAFAVSIHVEPDILVVDEALAVGDEGFQRKCFSRIQALRDAGTTILFVSHSAGTVVDLCDRAVMLEHGELIADGTPKHVVAQYQKLLHAPKEREDDIRAQIRATHAILPDRGTSPIDATRPASPTVEIEAYWEDGLVAEAPVLYEDRGAELEDPHLQTIDGRRVNVLVPGDDYVYAYRVRLREACIGVRCGMMIRTVTGIDLAGAVSERGFEEFARLEEDSMLDVRIRFRCLLATGTYFLNAGVIAHFGDGEEFVNRWVDIAMFRVMAVGSPIATGLVNLDVVPQVRRLEPGEQAARSPMGAQ